MTERRSCDVHIDREAAVVWATVADPGSMLEWGPGVLTCQIEGTIRRATLDGLGDFVERFSVWPGERIFEYSILEAPFDLEQHVGRILVREDGVGSRVTYECEVSPGHLGEPFERAMQGTLESLRAHLEDETGSPVDTCT